MEPQWASCGRHLGRVVVVLFLCFGGGAWWRPGGGSSSSSSSTPGGVSGEAVYHRRHHDDQLLLNPPRHSHEVLNEDQALSYLVKYGYLKCNPHSRRKRDIPSRLDIVTEMSPQEQSTHSLLASTLTPTPTPGKSVSTVIAASRTQEDTGGTAASTAPSSVDGVNQASLDDRTMAASFTSATTTVIPTENSAKTTWSQDGQHSVSAVTSQYSTQLSDSKQDPSIVSTESIRAPESSTLPSSTAPYQQTITSTISTSEFDNVTVTSNVANTFSAIDNKASSTSMTTSNDTLPVLPGGAVVLSEDGASTSEASPASTQSSQATAAPSSDIGEEGAGSFPGGLSEGSELNEFDVCTEQEIAEALRHFQRIYMQQESGYVDMATLRSMNQQRCGNTDQKLSDINTPAAPVETLVAESASATRPTSRRKRRALERIAEVRKLRKAAVASETATKMTSLKRQQILMPFTEHDPAAEHERSLGLMGRIAKAAGREVAPSLKRRQQQLEEIRQALREEWRTPTGDPLSQHQYRSKRSASMMSNSASSSSEDASENASGNASANASANASPGASENVGASASENESWNASENASGNASADAATEARLRFDKSDGEPVTWRLMELGYSQHIPVDEVRGVLMLAFRMWSEVIPLSFQESLHGDANDLDIKISFGQAKHGACDNDFDGRGGEYAHSWATGDIHFDDDDDFRSSPVNDQISLLLVAVHEIGHVLGLLHVSRNYSIMYAIYSSHIETSNFELGWEDRKDVQSLYGPCKGKFDVVFDWIRPAPEGHLIFNTYFCRSEIYWMYENRYNRTRYGDPLVLYTGWKGLNTSIDTYVQTFFFDEYGLPIFDSFFFKGDKYYAYNNLLDKVVDGYPRLIHEDFGPVDNSSMSIPDNIDAVYYEPLLHSLIFFKDQYVFEFPYYRTWADEFTPNQCCSNIQLFEMIYPTFDGEEKVLDGYIDTAYYVQNTRQLYFFKGEDIWLRSEKLGEVGLTYEGKWWDHFYDICEP